MTNNVLETHARDALGKDRFKTRLDVDALLKQMYAGMGNRSFGCEYCGNCTQRAKQEIPHTIGGGWNFKTSLAKLRDGLASGCDECGIYLDAVNTFLQDKCHCHKKSHFEIDIRMYHYTKQDKLGCYVWLENLPYGDLHASQDHDTFTERKNRRNPLGICTIPDPRSHDTRLEIFQGEDRQASRRNGPAPANSVPGFGNLRSQWFPSGDVASAQALDTLKYWIDECTNTHQDCISSVKKPLPKRILNTTTNHVYLQELTDTNGEYACLSHCWGPRGPALRLTATTSEQLRAGVLTIDLPKVFAQAVELCNKLSIPYLWIDALCIEQDSADDWKDAAASMGTIYENSCLTIAASWSSDSNGGLFSSERSSTYEPRKLEFSDLYVKGISIDAQQNVLRDRSGTIQENERKSLKSHWPLLTRAWVYQERQLSRRMVHFGKEKLLWECKSGQCSEEHPQMLTNQGHHTPKKILTTESTGAQSAWNQAVTQFSLLDLTYESDRLPALAAIAHRMMLLRPDSQYIAGMWTDTMVKDLAWHREGSSLPRPRTQHYVPSWSWASTQGPLKTYGYDPSVEFLGLTFTSTGPPQLGGVLDARLHLKGPVFRTTVPKSTRNLGQIVSPSFQKLLINLDKKDFDYSTNDAFEDTMPVTLLIIGGLFNQRLVALILHRSGDDWERIGFTYIWHPHNSIIENRQLMQDFLKTLSVKEVCII